MRRARRRDSRAKARGQNAASTLAAPWIRRADTKTEDGTPPSRDYDNTHFAPRDSLVLRFSSARGPTPPRASRNEVNVRRRARTDTLHKASGVSYRCAEARGAAGETLHNRAICRNSAVLVSRTRKLASY